MYLFRGKSPDQLFEEALQGDSLRGEMERLADEAYERILNSKPSLGRDDRAKLKWPRPLN